MKALSPKNKCQYFTSRVFKYLSKSCSKIIDNIQQVEGEGGIITEIDTYSGVESLAVIDVNHPYVDFWNKS